MFLRLGWLPVREKYQNRPENCMDVRTVLVGLLHEDPQCHSGLFAVRLISIACQPIGTQRIDVRRHVYLGESIFFVFYFLQPDD
jgi:hypothetical protein